MNHPYEKLLAGPRKTAGVDRALVAKIAEDLKLKPVWHSYLFSKLTTLSRWEIGKRKSGTKPTNEAIEHHLIAFSTHLKELSDLSGSSMHRRAMSYAQDLLIDESLSEGLSEDMKSALAEENMQIAKLLFLLSSVGGVLARAANAARLKKNFQGAFEDWADLHVIDREELIGGHLPTLFTQLTGMEHGLRGATGKKIAALYKIFLADCLRAMHLPPVTAGNAAKQRSNFKKTNQKKLSENR